MRRPIALTVVFVLALPAGAASPTLDPPGATARITVGYDGQETADVKPDLFQHRAAVTPDARFVAFSSAAPRLTPEDANGLRDVFVHDRVRGTTELVSVSSTGELGDNDSTAPAISADGRFVAFMSNANTLVERDFNGVWDIFVHDRATRTTERVSVSTRGDEAHGWSRVPSISADGRYVAFDSAAETLVDDDGNGRYDVFVHDRQTRTTRLLSRAPDGAPGNQVSYSAVVSGDGTAVAFYSSASNLVPGDANGYPDVFLADLAAGAVERVSVAGDGTEANDMSHSPALSADGRYVAFASRASNLVPNDQNGAWDHFVRDRLAGRTHRVSLTSAAAEHDDTLTFVPTRQMPNPKQPALSADGRFVVFSSRATNLGAVDTNAVEDVFVHDRVAGTTERVSLSSGGAQADGRSFAPAISGDGRVVVFTSHATTLVPHDTNAGVDVFVRDRGPATGIGDVNVQRDGGELALAGWARFAPVVTSADDPVGDATGGPAGADLVGVDVAHRPESLDVLVRWRLAGLPGVRTPGGLGNVLEVAGGVVPTVAGAPGVGYHLRFMAGGVSYELRASRTVQEALLFRCGPTCTLAQRLPVGFGTAGVDIVAVVPLDLLGSGWNGTPLSGVRASTSAGDVALTPAVTLDELTLASVDTSASLEVVGRPSGTSAGTFTPSARFAIRVPANTLAPGDDEVEIRACASGTCGQRRAALP